LVGQKEVPKKKYPPEVSYSGVLKGMVRESVVDLGFHSLMAILLVTGLIIDLLGPWLGGWLSSIRLIAHGYIGALFVVVFVIYLIKVAVSKRMRTVFTATNYLDFLFYAVLVVTGIAISSASRPWIDILPGLSDLLHPLVVYAPMIHVTTTYTWIVFSTVFPGGLLHGIASAYLISFLKKKYKTIRWRVR